MIIIIAKHIKLIVQGSGGKLNNFVTDVIITDFNFALYTDVCIALYTRCFPSVCDKNNLCNILKREYYDDVISKIKTIHALFGKP